MSSWNIRWSLVWNIPHWPGGFSPPWQGVVVQAFHQAFAAQQLVFVQCAASAPGCPKNWLSYVEDGAIVPSPDPSDPTHKKVPRMWIFSTKPWFLGFNIRILGEGISNFREKRGFTSPWILRYPIFRSTQIIDSIQIHSDVPATQAGCFQTFRCCWKVPARFGVVNNFFRLLFPHDFEADWSFNTPADIHCTLLRATALFYARAVDLKLGVFENGRYPQKSQNGNVCWQHDEAIWDAPYFDQLCFQELHCPFCSCLEGSKKSCGQSLSIGSFPFLAAGLCYCAGIPLQANLLTENGKNMHHYKSWMWYFAWGYRMASLCRVATIYSVFLAARGRPRLRLWCCENLTCCVTAMHSRRKLWSRLLGDHRRIGTARSCRTLDLSMPCCNALLRNVLGKLATDGNCSPWPPEPPELVLRWQPALKFGARKWTWNCSRQHCL